MMETTELRMALAHMVGEWLGITPAFHQGHHITRAHPQVEWTGDSLTRARGGLALKRLDIGVRRILEGFQQSDERDW